VPEGTDRATWLEATAGVRQSLRDEVVHLYREERVDAKRVAWLVRHLAATVKSQWEKDEFYRHRTAFRVPFGVHAGYAAGVTVLIVGSVLLVGEALRAGPFTAAAATLGAVAGTLLAAPRWLRVALERRRYGDALAEAGKDQAARDAAFRRWKHKLRERPDDSEMAHWLDCDHKALVERAMAHYRLAAHDVIAHAFVEAPAKSYKRARVPNGPWRFSRYHLLVFLLTRDGVRQVSATLDFEKATFHGQERMNYRYDAVAAVHVVDSDNGDKKLALTLVNNHKDEISVTGPPPNWLAEGENDGVSGEITQDAAGVARTLHVLEGIAAEGKEWIGHERFREQAGLDKLIDAVDPPGASAGA